MFFLEKETSGGRVDGYSGPKNVTLGLTKLW